MKPKTERKEPVMNKENDEGQEIRRNVPAVIENKSRGIVVGWALLALFIAVLAFSLYYFRDSLEKDYPVAAEFYQKWDYVVLGKETPAEPIPEPVTETVKHPASYLTMRQSAEVRFTDGSPGLALALEVRNDGIQDVELPILNGVIRNAEGVEVFTWVMKLDPYLVPAGGLQQYNINVDNIPADSAFAEVSFDWK